MKAERRHHSGRLTRGARGWAVGGLILVALLGSIGFAAHHVVEAREERRAATAATKLRIAALDVAAADALAEVRAPAFSSTLTESVRTLNSSHDLALHALTASDRVAAQTLLDEIAGCGVALLNPDGTEHTVHDHEALTAMLQRASSQAEVGAADAEQQAMWAIAAAVGSIGAGIAWTLLRRRRRRGTQNLAEAQARAGERLQSLLNDSPEIFLVIDPDGTITYRSASADSLVATGTVSHHALIECAAPDDRRELNDHLLATGEAGAQRTFALTGADGVTGWFDVRVSDLSADPLVGGRVVTLRDVTEEVQLRDELERQARTDLLTGLPNRRVLGQTIDGARAQMRAGVMMALIILDIDGFKTINDTLGHLAGDRMLRQISSRLRQLATVDETVLRLGGDEFAVVVANLASPEAIRVRAERFLAAFEAPVHLDSGTERVHVSIGVAATADPEHADLLLGEADAAMYQGKRRGGNAVTVHEPTSDSAASRTTRIIRALHEIDHDTEFSLAYQPIVEATSDRIVCVEALLRWTSPQLGVVGPDEFIPLAEEIGEIGNIGRWVFDRACAQLADWDGLGIDESITVSINVSPRQLTDDGFLPEVLAAIARWSVDPRRLTVEVTESATVDHGGVALDRLNALREAGLRVAIDDFGSGYSNLGQLLQVPFDAIKIDRSMLLTLSAMREQAGGDPTAPCVIMEAIVTIAQTLGAPVVCEGVETAVQRLSLQRSGIDYIQGYLTGRPEPAEHTTALLRSQASTMHMVA